MTGLLTGADIFMVDIGTNNTADVHAHIFALSYSGSAVDVDPSSNPILATSAAVNGRTIPTTEGYVFFDFSSSLFDIVAGQTYVLAFTSTGPDGSEFQLRGNIDGYAGGSAFHGSLTADPLAGDFGFRTYVSPVPLPASLPLLAAGLAGLGWVARRRKALRWLIAYVALAIAVPTAKPASAECWIEDFPYKEMDLAAVPPAQIDLSLRPDVPECLGGLSDPKYENCPRDELATFGAAVEIWSEALHSYVNETNRYANQVAEFANSAIAYAQEARRHADAALDFANCEATETSGSNE